MDTRGVDLMAKKKIITQAMKNKAESLAMKGLNNEQIAYSLGMAKSTLYKLISEDSDILEYIKRGQMSAIEDISNALYETALQGNTTAQIFFLKNRAGWKDKNETEISGGLKHEVIEVVFR